MEEEFQIFLINAKYLNSSDVVPVTIKEDGTTTINELREQLLSWFSIIPTTNANLVVKGKKISNGLLFIRDFPSIKDGSTIYIIPFANEEAPISQRKRESSLIRPKPPLTKPGMNGKALSAMITQMMSANPDLMVDMMQQSNPALKKMLDENPQMRHLLRDPQHITEILEANNDPSKMREMQRGQDRALSNIENMPGGMQALESLYLSATEAEDSFKGGNRSIGMPSIVKNTKSIKPNTPLPNPWSSSKRANTSTESSDSSDDEGTNFS